MEHLSIPKETPRADPHAGCGGSRGRKPPATRLGLSRPVELHPAIPIILNNVYKIVATTDFDGGVV
jgi:hypothetical protein